MIPFAAFKSPGVTEIGGKARSLLQLMRAGFAIPQSFCLPVQCYDEFIRENKLAGRIELEINRKDLSECRWEELWDTALRIRNCFLKGKISEKLRQSLNQIFALIPVDTSLAVRSSSTVEDSINQSFAGLHDSYLGIKNLAQLEHKVILVWASLWSDAALSYRKELRLNVAESKMAVVIQAMMVGETSGIAFSQNPLNQHQAVIEAVYGLNQGLVDGRVQPDRWFLDRSSGKIVEHQKSDRREKMVDAEGGQILIANSLAERSRPPLDKSGVKKVYSLCCKAEKHFKQPQDVEWTIRQKDLFLLQSRPITTRSKPDPKENRRDWDLTLKRSFENLLQLQRQIKQLLKKMTRGAEVLERQAIVDCSDVELVEILKQRGAPLQYWIGVYWDVFIPYAHGMRLFGQVYNETVCPDDPFEFVTLLQKEANLATRRNNELLRLAEIILLDEQSKHAIRSGDYGKLGVAVVESLHRLVKDFAMPGELLSLSSGNEFCRNFFSFVTRDFKTARSRVEIEKNELHELERRFLAKFRGAAEKKRARQLLELGRHSFLMRDDDNVYLNRFKDLHHAVISEMRRRREPLIGSEIADYNEEDLVAAILNRDFRRRRKGVKKTAAGPKSREPGLKRQLVGQPAGPGFARGVARVIVANSDLFALQDGEIIVCDAIGPEMTFAVPLAGGIIERRGGMLIHGAIIAREYGIPCVTGVSDAIAAIKSGDNISLDGHLGLVTIERASNFGQGR